MKDRAGASPFLDPPTVGADDRGFLLGDGVFETVRVYRGVPFRLSAHLERLAAGARVLGLPHPGDLAPLIEALLEKAGTAGAAARPVEAALRVTLTRGRGGSRDLGGEAVGDPEADPGGRRGGGPCGAPREALDAANPATVALRLDPLPPDAGSEPPRLTAMIEGRLHEDALASGIKGVGFLERILALRRARARGADEALVRNARGELVEGSASNLVALLPDGVLVSPGPSAGALPGITRGIVLEQASALGFRIQERGLAPGELRDVTELLLTSSIREIAVITAVEGTPVGEAGPAAVAPGSLAGRLHAALRSVVEREIGRGAGTDEPG